MVLMPELAGANAAVHTKTAPDVRASILEHIVGLHDLPTDHALRCVPLAGCWYRWNKGKDWRQVKPTFGIAGSAYNDLGPAWTENSVFCWEPMPPNASLCGRA